jgi:hypothetical protein
MVERGEELVEVDSLSFKDALPLGGWDSAGRVGSDLDEEFGFGHISVVGPE